MKLLTSFVVQHRHTGYAIAANVYSIHVLPVDLRRIALLVIATLLPFIPVVLMSVPLRDPVQRIAGVLL